MKGIQKITKALFSMGLMVTFLFLFFLAIAAATFIENDFGTPVAQKWIYKAFWFECIIGYLSVSLLYNMFRHKLFQWKKIGSLTFHIAFLVIVLGALITRKIGFEGVMSIREGEASNVIISAETFIQIKIDDEVKQYSYDMPVIMDTATNNYFNHVVDFPGQEEKIEIEFQRLIYGVKDTLIPTRDGERYIDVVTAGMHHNYIASGTVMQLENGLKVAFNNDDYTEAIRIYDTDTALLVQSPYDMSWMQMSDQSTGIVQRDSLQEIQVKRLYTVGEDAFFTFANYYLGAEIQTASDPKNENGRQGVVVKVKQGAEEKEVTLVGGKGLNPRNEFFTMNGLNYRLGYGSTRVELPFYIYLRDFQLDRYPGTDNPSSFASEVTLIDPTKNLKEDHRIFMNNVLDYGGYRFFQSSYDPDEKGTILSVNQDVPGTLTTYIGYFLLGLGFILNLFGKNSRFRLLINKSKEIREKREANAAKVLGPLILFFGLSAGSTYAQGVHEHSDEENVQAADETPVIDADHAEKFARLLVQDYKGRFEPMHTHAMEFVRKISRQDTYNGQSAMQVFLGMHLYPQYWNWEPFVYVSGKDVRQKLNIEGSRACFLDFISPDFTYILHEDAAEAKRKKPAEQSQYDKDILKTDERFSLLLGIFEGYYMKIFPLPNDSTYTWYSPYDETAPFLEDDKNFVSGIMKIYHSAVYSANESGDWNSADKVVDLIQTFQIRNTPEELLPSASVIELEIAYNKANIFKRLMSLYILVGLVLLILQFIQLFIPKMKLKWPIRIGAIIFVILWAIHGAGLGLRWYLSGHAPWSDAYEAVVFIAFVTMTAGLSFYKQNKIVLGAAAVLAWLMLFVAHMNQMDPEISALQPVLKSYWLMIHVAIITGSYAFLGLGAILGLIILTMNLFLRVQNKSKMLLTTKELTYVSEMTITIGLFMLTIGTFLGGVWANESWGRYWGWDAKETWALASVIVYGMILHFRFVPGLKSQFAFNTASLWGYASILMTFFGVNYYLSGLHSYAQGDPVPIPAWVPATVIVLFLLNAASYWRYKIVTAKTKPQSEGK